ncbi:MAG: Bug family tripartite tricarboxylate transporter substrate binding protein [Burkholderiales bacterium]
MKRSWRNLYIVVLLFTATYASAQGTWPNRPVRMVITSPSGGTVDLLARMLAEHFTKTFAQPFVVEARAGANGTIGVASVVNAPPDGHALFVTTPGPFSTNMHLHAKLPFDASSDLAPIAMLAYTPLLVVVHPSVPAKTWPELAAWLKGRPGKVNYASLGVGTTSHLGIELLKFASGVDMLHVPYKGSTAGFADLLSGEVQVTLNTTSAMMPFLKKGQLRAIAGSEKQRSSSLPDVPTLNESGVPGFDVMSWFGLGTRAGVSRDIINRLAQESANAMKRPEVVKTVAPLGLEIWLLGPEPFADYIRTEYEKWGEIIRRVGIKAE